MRRRLDDVVGALADPTRRHLLDGLHKRNGMTRQWAKQHLQVLAAANLAIAARRGREKPHYVDQVTLSQIQERWIHKLARSRVRALGAVKRRAEEAMNEQPAFVYVIYIQSAAEQVWRALTDPELTASYWGHSNVSDWQAGSTWEHRRTDGTGIADVVGTVVQSAPPRRLVTTWAAPGQERAEGPTRVTFDIEPYGDIVRLTVTHENLTDDDERAGAAAGWAAVLSNLKSLLETGHVLPQQPWKMPRR